MVDGTLINNSTEAKEAVCKAREKLPYYLQLKQPPLLPPPPPSPTHTPRPPPPPSPKKAQTRTKKSTTTKKKKRNKKSIASQPKKKQKQNPVEDPLLVNARPVDNSKKNDNNEEQVEKQALTKTSPTIAKRGTREYDTKRKRIYRAKQKQKKVENMIKQEIEKRQAEKEALTTASPTTVKRGCAENSIHLTRKEKDRNRKRKSSRLQKKPKMDIMIKEYIEKQQAQKEALTITSPTTGNCGTQESTDNSTLSTTSKRQPHVRVVVNGELLM